MKSSSGLLVVTLLCIALTSLHSLSAQSDVETLTVGDSVEDAGRGVEFLLDAEEGETVTLRWEGTYRGSRCNAPLQEIIEVVTEVTNVEGDALEQTGVLYTSSATIQVYTLEGTAPYAVSAAICGGNDMSLSVIEGDAIPRAEQPALNIGETASVGPTPVGSEEMIVFPLNVQAGDVFTIDAHFLNTARSDDYPMNVTVVRDANGQVVPPDFSERLPQELSLLAPVYTVGEAVPYRLELPAIPLYNAGYAARFGEENSDDTSYSVELEPGNTAIIDAGLVAPGTEVEGVLDERAVIYTFDVGEGETFTLRRDFEQTPSDYFLNAEDYNPDVVSFFVNEGSSLIWVMWFVGPPPYTYYLQGQGSYSLLLEAGDTLTHEIGRLAPGGQVQGTISPADDYLEYIALDVNPETTVTLNWNVPGVDFYITALGTPVGGLFPLNDSLTDGYGVFDLSQGTPPFIVLLNEYSYAGQPYTLTLAEGETPLSPDGAAAANTSGNADTSTVTETQPGADTQADAACTVSASSSINQRSGPGTNFDVSGTLAGSAGADGQATGANGFTWYRLTTGGWVRSDLVTATAECAEVPEAAP